MAFTDNTTGTRIIKQGIMPVKLTLTDTCEVGDLIGYEGVTDNEWQRADANGKVLAQLIAGEPCDASGTEITCFKMAVIDGFSGATTGDMVYLADDVGDYAATPASWVMQGVGECISTTEAFIHPSCSPVSAYASTGTGHAAYFRTEVESGRTCTSPLCGVRIDFKIIDGATLGSGVYPLYLFLQAQDTDAASADFYAFRIEDGCSASCHPESYIQIVSGGTGATYTFDLHAGQETPSGGCFSSAAQLPTGNGGYIAVKTHSGARYIALYTANTGG